MGMGSVYRQRVKPDGMSKEEWKSLPPKEKDRVGKLQSENWYIRYYADGRLRRECADSPIRAKAESLLRTRLGEAEKGDCPATEVKRIRVSELVEDLFCKYQTGELKKGKKSLSGSKSRWKLHLEPFFGGIRALSVGSDTLTRYIKTRQGEGAANATINRELAIIRAAFNIAAKSTPPKVAKVPTFPNLEESTPRVGFLTDEQYDRLALECARVGLWLRAMLSVGCRFSWRKGELRTLRVGQVDLSSRTIRLDVGSTKNSDGRTVKLTNDTQPLIAACIEGKKPDDYVFTHDDGSPVGDFRKVWWSTCVRAGLGQWVCPDCSESLKSDSSCPKCKAKVKALDRKYEGLIFHDLRRTGARNMRRAGIPESVIMTIGGWRTPSMFRRYAIVCEDDLADAARSMDDLQVRRMEQQQNAAALNEHKMSINTSVGRIARA